MRRKFGWRRNDWRGNCWAYAKQATEVRLAARRLAGQLLSDMSENGERQMDGNPKLNSPTVGPLATLAK